MTLKYDGGKLRWSLLPLVAVREVVKVLEYGAKKYTKGDVSGADNWKTVPHLRERYWDAAVRHLVAWQLGEPKDDETGLSHLAHATCCLLFLLWDEERTLTPPTSVATMHTNPEKASNL